MRVLLHILYPRYTARNGTHAVSLYRGIEVPTTILGPARSQAYSSSEINRVPLENPIESLRREIRARRAHINNARIAR